MLEVIDTGYRIPPTMRAVLSSAPTLGNILDLLSNPPFSIISKSAHRASSIRPNMSTTDASKPSDVTATLQYLKWEKLYESQKPYQVYFPTEDTPIPKSNLSFEDGPEELIHDARYAEESFDLDRNGFTS